jgi:diguanylate cyclase (GGDEF)-like protein
MFYIAASLTTIILLILETVSFLVERPNEAGLVIPSRIINVLGFSLTPLVPFFILLFASYDRIKGVHKKLLAIPLYINAFICVLSYLTGWVFFVDAKNQYMRGDLFILPSIICMFYYVLIVIDTCQKRSDFERENKRFLFLVFSLPVIASIIQILLPELLLIWGSVSISLLLYYVFLLEAQFNFDIQTGLMNRTAFEKEMQQYQNVNATIFIFDINNLKRTNDKFGHNAGDNTIKDAANIIKACFIGIGKTYRIGGDEFCVICREISEQSAEGILANFNDMLITANQNRPKKIEVAHGYASCNFDKGETFETAFSKADNAMYEHKAKLKGVYGRRSGDQ